MPSSPRSHRTTRSNRPTGAAAVAQRLVVGCLLLLAALPPLLWLVVGGLMASRGLSSTVEQGHWSALPERVALAPEAVPAALLQGGRHQADWVGLLDEQERAHAEAGQRPAWPALAAERLLRTPGKPVQLLRAERSLRPLLVGAMLAAMASTALCVGLWRVAYLRPVSSLEKAEGRILSHAWLDPLTGLVNREGLRRRLRKALEQRPEGEGRRRPGVGVLLVDIDRFNLINGTLGQGLGDALLCGVAERLRQVTRRHDTLARMAADQYAVVMEHIHGTEPLAAAARNMQRAFEAPFKLEGREIVVTLSLGGAVAGHDGDTVDELLHNAGAAMRAAKTAGGARLRLFEAAMDAAAHQRLEMDLRLRRALSAGQFFLLYQPIIDARTGRPMAVEALLRWRDPERGVVAPSEFIGVLEETGLIVSVGHWVLYEACRKAVRWQQEGGQPMVLSVNISPRQFAEPDFLDKLQALLARTGFPPGLLQLEVTEGLLLEPTPQTLERLDALAALGIRIALDDFGMGYSSLGYLKRFKLHALKVDRMFVCDLGANPRDEAIVRAIVELGHALGLKITAEGVETQAQAEVLRRVGCDGLQGFLFGTPHSEDKPAPVASV